MSDRISKVQRWLDVVAFLAARRFPVSTDELWAHVPAYARGVDGTEKEKAAVRRMFERDKDELRALGIPIETVTFRINWGTEESSGYVLARKDFHLPYLRLVREAEGDAAGDSGAAFDVTEEEARAALDGLRELAAVPSFPLARQARSAFRKLAFDLEPELVGETPVLYAEDPEAVATADVLRALSAALLARKRVRFRYHAIQRDRISERTVRGYGLVFQHGRWYLVGHDEDRGAVRMFRVGRMSRLEPNARAPGTPDFAVPDDFALDAYAGRKAWELGGEGERPIEATVLFRFPRSLWAERNGHGALVEARDDGSQLRRFRVHRRDPFLRWVLSLAGDARVTSPDDLRDEFRGMVRAVANRYRDPPGEAPRG